MGWPQVTTGVEYNCTAAMQDAPLIVPEFIVPNDKSIFVSFAQIGNI